MKKPCPTFGQLAGLGGGFHERCEMSQGAMPTRITQPMLPEGERKVVRWTVLDRGGGATVVLTAPVAVVAPGGGATTPA